MIIVIALSDIIKLAGGVRRLFQTGQCRSMSDHCELLDLTADSGL